MKQIDMKFLLLGEVIKNIKTHVTLFSTNI